MTTPFEMIICVNCNQDLGEGKRIGVGVYEYVCPKCKRLFHMIMGRTIVCPIHGPMTATKTPFPAVTTRFECMCGPIDVVWD